MTLEENNHIPPTGNNTDTTSKIVTKNACMVVSLLGMYKLEFDFKSDIELKELKDLISSGKFFIGDFEENGYGCIMQKNPDMGTGYAIVSEQYLENRGEIQGIKRFNDEMRVGITYYINENGERKYCNIYIVGSGIFEGKPIGKTLSLEEIDSALHDIKAKGKE